MRTLFAARRQPLPPSRLECAQLSEPSRQRAEAQGEAQFGVDLGGSDRDVHDGAASDVRFNLGEVLARRPRIEGAVAQLADNGRRQKMLVDACKQPGVGLCARTSIATLVSSATRSPLSGVDALELTVDDLQGS